MSWGKKQDRKKENPPEEATNTDVERRGFLKKAAYATPTLIALGQLVRPREAKAGFGGPPSDPQGGAWG